MYAMAKYCALASDKGYSIGQAAVGYMELTNDGQEVFELLGYLEDLHSIKGSRNYVRCLNAPIIHRLLQKVPGSLYSFLKEEKELAQVCFYVCCSMLPDSDSRPCVMYAV